MSMSFPWDVCFRMVIVWIDNDCFLEKYSTARRCVFYLRLGLYCVFVLQVIHFFFFSKYL